MTLQSMMLLQSNYNIMYGLYYIIHDIIDVLITIHVFT